MWSVNPLNLGRMVKAALVYPQALVQMLARNQRTSSMDFNPHERIKVPDEGNVQGQQAQVSLRTGDQPILDGLVGKVGGVSQDDRTTISGSALQILIDVDSPLRGSTQSVMFRSCGQAG